MPEEQNDSLSITTTTTSSSKLSTKSLKNIVERLKVQCHRDSTRQNYYSIWKSFNKFLGQLDFIPEFWEDRIVLYIGHLISQNKQSATIKSYLSAIRAVLKQDNVELQEDEFLLRSLMRACKLKNDRVKLRLPIQKPMLNVLLKEVVKYFEKELNQPYLSLLYQTLFCTAYYGMLRIGEVTSGSHPILARDVQVGDNKKKILMILRSSKTHGEGSKPQSVKISSQPKSRTTRYFSTHFCPYKLLRHYGKHRGPFKKRSRDPFFVFSDGSKVTPTHARNCLKKILTRAKFDSWAYSFHSLRAGRTLDLLKYGLSVETIKKLGRWKSNAVFTYLKY